MQNEPVYERLVKSQGFSPAHKIIIEKVPNNLEILEVGSSSGYLTKEFTDKGCSVDVVEIDEAALKKASKVARHTFKGSIEENQVRVKITKQYDVIVCADVLEHLVSPEDTLGFLLKKIKRGGFILISIPNVAFWDMRKQLMFKGDFSYQESGLLDKTHLRFYSLNNFVDLLEKSGLKVDELIPAEARFPFEYSIIRIPLMGRLFLILFKNKIIWKWPNLTFFHYVIKAVKKT